MSRILFYLILKPISLLPAFILYGLSDVLFVILYSIVKYRRKVVQTNLRNSFPQKSESEIHIIESKFYRHLCDLMLESIRNFSISKAELIRRCPIANPEFLKLMLHKTRV